MISMAPNNIIDWDECKQQLIKEGILTAFKLFLIVTN